MSKLDCALDLMRRLPPREIEDNLAGLIDLCPDLMEDLLGAVDQPLKIAFDPVSKRDYLLCDYNRDADSYRYTFMIIVFFKIKLMIQIVGWNGEYYLQKITFIIDHLGLTNMIHHWMMECCLPLNYESLRWSSMMCLISTVICTYEHNTPNFICLLLSKVL